MNLTKKKKKRSILKEGGGRKKKAVNNMDLAKYQDHSGLPPWRI